MMEGMAVTEDLIGRVKAGDEHSFRQLIAPYQGELQHHRRVDQDRDGEPDAGLLEVERGQRAEQGEDADHDQGGGGDDPAVRPIEPRIACQSGYNKRMRKAFSCSSG
jgi:hypothetical protein